MQTNSMYLHTIILTLFRPFLKGPQRDQKLGIFTSTDSSPGAIYEASITQMKHIVLQHHLNYPGKLFSNFTCAGYIQLCNTMTETASGNSNTMNKSQRREQRVYFDICMCLFQDVYLQHELFLPIAQGLICMALQNNLIRTSKVRKIMKQFHERGEHYAHYSGLLLDAKTTTFSSPYSTTKAPPKMRVQIIVNFELAVVNVDAARAHSLTSKLEDLVLFDEFTNTTTAMEPDSDDSTDSNGDEEGNHQRTRNEIEKERENDYESWTHSGGSSVMGGSDYYWTPASEIGLPIY
ncbi:C6 transcription factor [Apiospora arundinis]